MSSDNSEDKCQFGHVFEVFDRDEDKEGPGKGEIRGAIKDGKIKDLKDLEDKENLGTDFLKPIMGDKYKHVKVSSGSQGLPHMTILAAADKFDEDWDGWDAEMVTEKIFVSPESQFHQEYMQKRNHAEENVQSTMQNYTQMMKQKHMLEHDVRKLRSKVENLKSGDETTIKADFIEIVDSAGGGQQGPPPGSLDFLRNNQIYPSIVADFQEMDSVEDLEEGGKLEELPENEKAVLKKKYKMYEEWKDLYGSEIERKLEELKGRLNSTERVLEELEKQLQPYARDLVMINEMGEDQDWHGDRMTDYYSFQGHSTMRKNFEFICYRPFEKEGDELVPSDENNATHYKVVYLFAVHVTIASGENPAQSSQGPTSGQVHFHPAIVCKHVFENIFKEKIDRNKKYYEQLLKDYTGELEPGEGKKLEEAREQEEMSVRELRKKVGEEIGETPPLDFSAAIRRFEDGFDDTQKIVEKYGEEYMKAIDEILGTEFMEEKEEHSEELSNIKKELMKFAGKTDEYYLPNADEELKSLRGKLKFNYYWDFKIGLGLNTVK